MTLYDIALLAVSGALGGGIYWAARTHGEIFSLLRNAFTRK